jgi:uncharacterized protein YjbI with pentapeptide repeats
MNLVLRSQNLQRRSFRGQDLSRSDFSGVNLSGADFTDAILDGADLSHADLRGTNFRRSSLVGANLSYSRSGIPNSHARILRITLLIFAVSLGISAGFIGSSAAGLLTNESKIFEPFSQIKFFIPWGTISGGLGIAYSIFMVFALRLEKPVISIVIGVGILVMMNIALSVAVISACQQASKTWEIAGNMVITIGGSAVLVLFQSIFTILCLSIVKGMLRNDRQLLLTTVLGISIALGSAINTGSSDQMRIIILIISSAIVWTVFSIKKFVSMNKDGYNFFDKIAIYISSYYGTCFNRSNLSNANLESALLADTNLSGANLTHTNFHRARHIDLARVDRTILRNYLVRNLLVTRTGNNRNYKNCDLHGAYLVNADLRNANFTGADLHNANLSHSQLTSANLTRTIALDTNFQSATLTGACIEDWSIDRTTKLADISCDYIYLKSQHRERSPGSGTFKPGDFTRLFQEVWHTVELIFQHGIDWTSFNTAWQQIQIENEGLPLAIHSIERKGEGTIVVKVEVPLNIDKTKLHQDFNAAYDLQLQSIKERHQVELAGRDREIAIYQSQQVQLNHILQSLVAPAIIESKPEQLVTIKLGQRDINRNLAVTVEIGDRGLSSSASAIGVLENEDEVVAAYQDWQIAYREYLSNCACRIDISDRQITNLSNLSLSIPSQVKAEYLNQKINQWLDSIDFRPIKDLMLQELHPDRSIQIILQTDHLHIRKLPLQLWSFFEKFPQAELAIASNIYRMRKRTPQGWSVHHTNLIQTQTIQPQNLKILAIFGDRHGIDLDVDYHLLAKCPNATVEFLIEPTRQLLNDKLWENPWDIIFFAGHSASTTNLSTGYLKINPTDKLTIPELKYALKQSIASGLKLVIINACDGLGLAAELLSIQIPQAIVMREPIPDFVAQQFLKSFLTAFSSGKSLYLSVRLAREQLQGLEDRYPCASWLPTICQNPAETL